MAKAICFGTFDGLHEGHRHFLAQASAHGELRVVVALDATVEKVKGRLPLHDQDERLDALRAEGHDAVLGRAGDKYAVIEEWEPEIVCLGYDQEAFTERLAAELADRGIEAEIVRLEPHLPEVYKSSKLNARPHRA